MGLNVERLKQSFKSVAPKADAPASRFYERLFQKSQAVKPLFKNASMAEQKKKLLASLVLVIQNLHKPEKLTEALLIMGARHVEYGAQPAHYDAVGENRFAVLAEFAGPVRPGRRRSNRLGSMPTAPSKPSCCTARPAITAGELSCRRAAAAVTPPERSSRTSQSTEPQQEG